MKFFERFIRWLTSKPERTVSRWDPYTNPIDIQVIASKLMLSEEGARLGSSGVPLDNASELTAPESKAVLEIEQARSDYVDWAQYRLKSLNGELTRLNVAPIVTAAMEGAEEFARRANADMTANNQELSRLAELRQSRQMEFEIFRKEHLRRDLPHYSRGIQKAAKVVFAVFLAVVDGLFNASFFASGLAGGLIDGFIQAFVAASVNVAACLAIGWVGIRYIHHIDTVKKLGGWIALLAGFVVPVIMGLAISHYREALIAGLETAQIVARDNLFQSPLGLREVSSWLLFLLTLAFGLVALWDGYAMDDPYPGYGKLHRRLVQAEDEYNNAIASLSEHLDDLKEKILQQIQEALDQSENAIVRIKNVIADKERCGQELENSISNSPMMLSALLAVFRDENILARNKTGYVTPPSFSSTPTLKRLNLPDFSTKSDVTSLEQQQALHQQLIVATPEIRSRILAAYNTNFSTVQTLANQFSGVTASGNATRPDFMQIDKGSSVERSQ
jgi:hypothetical protein